jgi:TonB-dependent SusC/RagA subfamily outer membrane receptor
MKRLFFLILCVCTFGIVSAQEQGDVPFNGIVEDAFGTPLKGARIWNVSPIYYATSNKMGEFGLTNVKPTDTLHVKYRKKVYDIAVDGKKSMRVRISDEVHVSVWEEEELVNTGYGFVKRRESCNATTGIPGELLVRTGRINILEAMRGMVPGVQISTSGKVVIRGQATIYGTSDPLFLVDNMEVDNLDYVNVYDVERVDVLKDANMYGAKGANGAILVTTKRGPRR